MGFEVNQQNDNLVYQDLDYVVKAFKGIKEENIDYRNFSEICNAAIFILELGESQNDEKLKELGITLKQHTQEIFQNYLKSNIYFHEIYINFLGELNDLDGFKLAVSNFREQLKLYRIDEQIDLALYSDNAPEFLTRIEHTTKIKIASMLRINFDHIKKFELYTELHDLFEYSVTEMSTSFLDEIGIYLKRNPQQINSLIEKLEVEQNLFLEVFNHARVKIFRAILCGVDEGQYINNLLIKEIQEEITKIRQSKQVETDTTHSENSVKILELFSDEEIDFVFGFIGNNFSDFYTSAFFNLIRDKIDLETILEPIRGFHFVFRKDSSELNHFMKKSQYRIESPYEIVNRVFKEKKFALVNPDLKDSSYMNSVFQTSSLDIIYLHIARMTNGKYKNYKDVSSEDEYLFYLSDVQSKSSKDFPLELKRFIYLQRENILNLYNNDYTTFEVYINALKNFYQINSPSKMLKLMRLIFEKK